MVHWSLNWTSVMLCIVILHAHNLMWKTKWKQQNKNFQTGGPLATSLTWTTVFSKFLNIKLPNLPNWFKFKKIKVTCTYIYSAYNYKSQKYATLTLICWIEDMTHTLDNINTFFWHNYNMTSYMCVDDPLAISDDLSSYL